MRTSLVLATVAGALALTSVASAQEAARPTYGERRVAAPDRALEIGIAGGYAQGVGDVTSRPGDRLQNLGGPGGAGELDLGWRFSPGFSLGVYGTGAQYRANEGTVGVGTDVRRATAGVQAVLHARPYRAIDPWLGIGAGWRGYWVAPERGGATVRHGAELARVELGVDYRVAPELAIGPLIGASANLFLAEQTPGAPLTRTTGERVNAFVFAGIAARFDVAGYAKTESTNVAAR